jgi:predicted nucleic acid-binding protein
VSEVADRFVAVLDANVLYPFGMRDALLRFAEAGLYRARWSEDILAEWTGKLLKQKPHLGPSIESQLQAMQRAFPEARVEGYQDLIESLGLPDKDDRHVLAAAIRSDAQVIVTENLRDFPTEALSPYEIEARSADSFLASTFELYPQAAIAALREMRRAYTAPAMSPGEFIVYLNRQGLAQLAAFAKEEIDIL